MRNFGTAILHLACVLPSLAAQAQTQWLLGEGPAVATAKVIVFGDYANLRALRLDLDHLEGLQKRFGERGVCVAARLRERTTAEPVKALKPAVPVGYLEPPPGSAPDAHGRADLFAGLDRLSVAEVKGKGSWQGAPQFGLSWFVEQALLGKLDVPALAGATQQRNLLLSQFGEQAGIELRPRVEQVLQYCPQDGVAWGMRYVIEAERLCDTAAAQATLGTACKNLEPAALAAFADLALRSEPRNRDLGLELVGALTPAAASVPRDLRVQLCLLRALVRAGADREVGRVASMLAKPCGEHADLALLLAEILADASMPAVHKDLAQRALDQAAGLGANPMLLAAARHKVAARCGEDQTVAKQLADAFVEAFARQMTLNGAAWQFMTQLETKGRYDPLVLDLCERMLEDKNISFSYIDTVAVAMFVNGRLQEALDLQKKAIGIGGIKPTFAERLLRYETALQRQQSKKGK